MAVDLLNEKYEFSFTEDDFNALRSLITERTGIELSETKKSLLYSRLVRRVRHHKLAGFSDYYQHIQNELSRGKNTELIAMINAMTTNVTHFFREQHHFKHLEETLHKIAQERKVIHVWSAASSIGAEPWSIAFTVQEFKKKNLGTKVNIYASDLDSHALAKAKEATYTLDEKELKAHPLLRRYMTPVKQKNKEIKDRHLHKNTSEYTVIPALHNSISFFEANLLENWSAKLPSRLDVIFCRNVIIYFGRETKVALFKKFAQKQKEGDILYIGHSESLMGVTDLYTPLGKTMYVRNGTEVI